MLPFEREIKENNIRKALQIQLASSIKDHTDLFKAVVLVTEALNVKFKEGVIGEDALEKSFDVIDDIIKARATKYIKREGTPGNYKYYYTKAEYDKAKKEGGGAFTPKNKDISKPTEEKSSKKSLASQKQERAKKMVKEFAEENDLPFDKLWEFVQEDYSEDDIGKLTRREIIEIADAPNPWWDDVMEDGKLTTKNLKPGMWVMHKDWDQHTSEPMKVVKREGKIMLWDELKDEITEPTAGGESDDGWELVG